MSDWTKWSVVDDSGTTYRYRYVLRPALNGGKECADLLQIRIEEMFFILNYNKFNETKQKKCSIYREFY
jgi:hypothetical protein